MSHRKKLHERQYKKFKRMKIKDKIKNINFSNPTDLDIINRDMVSMSSNFPDDIDHDDWEYAIYQYYVDKSQDLWGISDKKFIEELKCKLRHIFDREANIKFNFYDRKPTKRKRRNRKIKTIQDLLFEGGLVGRYADYC